MGFGGADSLDHADIEAAYAAITVGTSAVELKVGAAALDDRKAVTIQPKANKIYWGYSSAVTTSTGTRIFKDQFMPLPVGPNIQVWLIADGAGKDVRIGELA